MSQLKLVALLIVTFIATGSVVYQIRSRRPARPIAGAVSPGAAPIVPVAPVAPAAPAQVPIADPTAAQPEAGAETPASAQPRTNIPAGGWGRNPFLTREEIDKANEQPVTQIVETPGAPAPIAKPAGPPTYTVTAIIYGPNGSFAVVNSRVVQEGDRVGVETVKEIKSRAVVLEYEGNIRELPLRRQGPQIQLDVPRGD